MSIVAINRPSQMLAPFALGGTALAVLAAALAWQLGLPAAAPALSLAAFAALTAIVLGPAARDVPDGFGLANRVTLARGVLVCLLAGLIAAPGAAWLAFAVAIVAGGLDAVDGWLARRLGQTSHFGARFDMETDALFLAVLSLLVWQWDKAGPWVLAIGAMRYAFAAAALVWPALRGALPPSRRRQTVCVVQVVALVACLAPPVAPPLASGLAAGALALLTLSFAGDVRFLLRKTIRTEPER